MNKTDIKNLLREAFVNPITEEEPTTNNPDKHRFDKEYSEVQSKLQNTMLKQSQVMAAAGLGDPDNATDRSLFSKKVRKDKNEEGGQYLFSDEDLAKVIKVLNNPGSYLNVKNR